MPYVPVLSQIFSPSYQSVLNPNQKVLYSYHDSNPMVNFERTSEYKPLNNAKSQSALKPQHTEAHTEHIPK